MDCIEAQSVISEALDRSPVDAAVLGAAKDHCRECPQCGQYVRALNAIRRAEPPRPPEELVDRIMVAVRAEADAAAATAAQPLAADATAPVVANTESPAAVPSAKQPDALGAALPDQTQSRVTVGGGRFDRRQLLAWGSAAAVVLLVVGVSAAVGIMRLVNSPGTQVAATDASRTAAGESAPKAADSTALSAGAAGEASGAQAPATVAAAPQNLYMAYGGEVYVQQGVAPSSKSGLAAVGQTRMTFEAGTPPVLHTVYRGKETDAVYVERETGDLQRFALVKRVYRQRPYRLRSGDLTEYGTWPTIPPGVPRPVPENNAAGTPAFALDGEDASGTAVYRRVGTDRRSGIAIAPGSPADDPAAGNPNWTWWTP